MAAGKKSNSSRNWLRRHVNDTYVKQAKVDGYRSRAVYKLLEILEKDKLIKKGDVIVDLGAAPGGWCQVAGKILTGDGKIIALDILPMDGIAGVDFIQGDFTEAETFRQLLTHIGDSKVNLVMSDMAPNISGIRAVDQPRAMYLAELAVDLAQNVLCSKGHKGHLVMKLFHGEGFDELVKNVRGMFKSVTVRKPKASRANSREVYLVAKEYRAS